MITLTQTMVDDALSTANCCFSELMDDQLDRLKRGKSFCKKTQRKIDKLVAAIYVLERFIVANTDEENCLTDDECYLKIETVSAICGCTNC